MEINPACLDRFRGIGLPTPADFLDLPGEVVSGHPDRHVVRVELPGWPCPLYLKRQHRVGWRERLRQALAGFGWASRCEREAAVLRQLGAAGLSCPRWVAYGEDGRGRAFLLVEELTGSTDLRHLLCDGQLSPADRRRLAGRLGEAVGKLHAAGFDTPDLTAKHIFVNPASFAATLIDWQSARRGDAGRTAIARLGALHASLADELAGVRDRLRFLRAYLRAIGERRPLAAAARRIGHEARRLAGRRSIRDQRQPATSGPAQRLVWLAGEAVCAIPEVAGVWPSPAVAAPFYDADPADWSGPVRLLDGRPAWLVRGRSLDPLGRFAARLRGKPWRSAGVTIGRVLFHLERYGIPGPRLLAFGQRETGPASAEWFALSEPPAGVPLAEWLAHPRTPALRHHVLREAGALLRRLHDAGCRGAAFYVDETSVPRLLVGDPPAVRIVRRLTGLARRSDLAALLRELPALGSADRLEIARAYRGEGATQPA